jgi:selT/selW/selH-like putative selenoprotein
MRLLVKNLISFLTVAFVLLLVAGNFISAIKNNPIFAYFTENKMYFLILYFLLSAVQNIVSQTGAFEVFINDKLIYSKLLTERVPSIEDIVSNL